MILSLSGSSLVVELPLPSVNVHCRPLVVAAIVTQRPEAKSQYELASTTACFIRD